MADDDRDDDIPGDESEEPDFDDEDEEIIDGVWDRIAAEAPPPPPDPEE